MCLSTWHMGRWEVLDRFSFTSSFLQYCVTTHIACFLPGHHGAMNQQHMMPSQAFQMRRSLPPDDIQDDFDWDSIV